MLYKFIQPLDYHITIKVAEFEFEIRNDNFNIFHTISQKHLDCEMT